MQTRFLPLAAFVLLMSCSPDKGGRDDNSGMAEGAPGGLSSRDTMPTSTDTGAAGEIVDASPAGVLSQMNVANTIEIQLSNLAARKATAPAVKQVAQKLATDHSKNREQVRALAQQLNVQLTPARGGSISAADSVAMPSDLEGESGAEFDRAFIRHEIADHQTSVQKIEAQLLPAAESPQIKEYLEKTLTEMKGHLASLQQVQQQLGS
jgi:putative membrane protein